MIDFSLLAISDRHTLGRDLGDWLEELAAAGVGAVQIREKDLADGALFRLAVEARRRLGSGVRLLINGRVDIARAAGADGVHLPASGLPVTAVRRLAGDRFLIGRSTHHPAEVEAARNEGADYVTFGPVWATPSKAPYGPPRGLGELRRAAGHAVPVFALGGVDRERFAEAGAAGAAGAAGIRMFQRPQELPALVAASRQAFSSAPQRVSA